MNAAIKITVVLLGFTVFSLAAPKGRDNPALVRVTTCVDPQYHFILREFRGIVLDNAGQGVPHVNGDLYRFKKDFQGDLEPSPDVFASFVADEQGRFSLPKLHKGLYLVVLHPPKSFWSQRVIVKLARNGALEGLIARLTVAGNCGASWQLPSEVD